MRRSDFGYILPKQVAHDFLLRVNDLSARPVFFIYPKAALRRKERPIN